MNRYKKNLTFWKDFKTKPLISEFEVQLFISHEYYLARFFFCLGEAETVPIWSDSIAVVQMNRGERSFY